MAKVLNKDQLRYEQEKRDFIEALRIFHYNRGTPFHLTPRYGNKEVDLYLLYQKVTALGGWKRVTNNLQWDDVTQQLNLPRACLNADQALKHVYIRYLNIYEQIHFLGEDPKVDTRRDDEGPIRKKHCGPQYNVHLSYNQAQHDVADNLRAGYGLATTYARLSDYDKLEKALLSGLPNEVDFVINVCTLLSNESKHTLRLERCAKLLDLLIAHCGVFDYDDVSLELLYENCWKENTDRNFVRFWYDTVDDEEARELISNTKIGGVALCGEEVLQLGRNLGVEDKEGIRITQVAIIIRNLSFDLANTKFLAKSDLVFRFLLLCMYCDYGTLRQLALDTFSNLCAVFKLDMEQLKSQTLLDILVKSIMSSDKFSVVTGLEMVSKLSQNERNEDAISDKLHLSVYEEISKYLTIADIQLIVYSLEALYQLSEIGEETNRKIAAVGCGSTIDTLVSLITVEAQSYGPNSLVGIKVVEYCPPPHLTGGAAEGMPGAVGPPATQEKQQSPQKKPEKAVAPDPPVPPSPIDTTTCNWLQATFQAYTGGVVSVISMFTQYLAFCKKYQLDHPLSSQDFIKTIEVVFPHSSNIMGQKVGGAREMCVKGVKKRAAQLPFAIAVEGGASQPVTVSETTAITAITPSQPERNVCVGVISTAPVQTNVVSAPVFNVPHQTIANSVPMVTVPTYALTGGVAAQGFITDPVPPPNSAVPPRPVAALKSKSHKKKPSKKITPVLPKAEQPAGNLPTIMPKVLPQQTAQITVSQSQPQIIQNQQLIPNVITTQDVVYQAVDQQNPESKVLVKTLLAQKIRTGNVIIQQPVQGVVNVQNMELGATGGDSQNLQSQTIQYQNIHPTYIQYSMPNVSATPTILQPNPPTIVMQTGGEVFVQGNLPSSLPAQQQIITQQPIMVPQQQVMVPQQSVMVSQQPMVVSQQGMVASQQVLVQQQPQQALTVSSQILNATPIMAPQGTVVAPSQVIQQSQPFVNQAAQPIISTNQVYIQPHATQTAFSSSSTTSAVIFTTTESLSSTLTSASTPSSLVLQSSSSTSLSSVTTSITSSSIDNGESASQSVPHSKQVCAPESNTTDSDTTLANSEVQMDTGQNVQNNSASESKNELKPSIYDNTNNCAVNVPVNSVANAEAKVTEVKPNEIPKPTAEIESAVGSIIDDSADSQDDEPVMIENDGNELMFEQQKYQMSDSTINPTPEQLFGGDEAAMAVEQLEQIQQDTEDDIKQTGVLIIDNQTVENNTADCDNDESEPMEVSENVSENLVSETDALITDTLVNSNDQMPKDQTVEICAERVEYKEGSVDKDSVLSDEELIAKFRTETPINVPLVSENGLLEQDFEARMAVENLLKDVEFKVNDEDGELNVIYACSARQTNAGNGNKVSENSIRNSDQTQAVQPHKDNRLDETQESQNSKSVIFDNHNSSSNISKPSEVHPLLNGVDSEHKPLMNGDLSSPECPSVPSPGLVNGGDKLVNGISGEMNSDIDKALVDKVLKINGVVKHKISDDLQGNRSKGTMEIVNDAETNDISTKPRTDDILAQSMIDSNIDKNEDSLDTLDAKLEVKTEDDVGGDILARSILENGIQPSDCEMADPEPVHAVVKQILPNYMTVQINNSTIPITFTSNAVISNKNTMGGINVCNSRHIPTPETARDGELSCDSTSSSITASEQIVATEKHSIKGQTTKTSQKDSKKLAASSGKTDSKKSSKSSSKKRVRSKSGGSSGGESRPSSVSSPATAAVPPPEFMCEWMGCRQCFDNARKVYNHVCNVHLKTEYDGLCKWEGCESLVRKRWSLFTHVQDHHCSENSLRVAAQRRLQSFQTGQKITAPTIPAMVYPKDAANQAIKRSLPKPPYPELNEGREGPVTKHIRLTSALILRNLAQYSRHGRTLLKKHERILSYTCMSAVESSTALASCLHELSKHK